MFLDTVVKPRYDTARIS
ncbi:palindromic element RPE4 domain-containing protein [Rickettsia sp. R2]|uniref:Palindromic element RPE4 domain-containing protein n=1 Tax=Rickettsia japonica TaxID=35790 RepID=A0ABM6YIG4_RICJA|nr:hypothetical protein RRIM16_04205 [Rickettsia conorii subsp. raoultii]AXU07155.1 palindromic element RPE4 domain-containing protein [Rickettsia japonica]QHE25510.1 palindromic element RPE4 domain-containing protein [Rickettsia japonica]